MKKFISKLLVSFLSLGLIILFTVPIAASNEVNLMTEDESYYRADSPAYINAPDSVKDMMDMQNKITLSLTKKNFRYEYDYNVIKDIVFGFDFTEYNDFTGENITSESFLQRVITGIESVEFPTIETYAYTTGPMCGVNKTDSIWNSTREYRNKSRTTQHANSLRASALEIKMAGTSMNATGFAAILASVKLISPVLGGIILGAKWTYAGVGKWMDGVGKSLQESNTKNNCGTVLDVNIAKWYSSWNQIDN